MENIQVSKSPSCPETDHSSPKITEGTQNEVSSASPGDETQNAEVSLDNKEGPERLQNVEFKDKTPEVCEGTTNIDENIQELVRDVEDNQNVVSQECEGMVLDDALSVDEEEISKKLDEIRTEDIADEVANVSSLPSVNFCFDSINEMASYHHPQKKYFIGCKWSPDGTCLLCNNADFTLRIFELPKEFYSITKWDKDAEPKLELKAVLEMVEGGLVYDYDWYPFMSSWNPATCCFVTSSAGSPVHLWDAYTGKIRASYRAYDFADELHSGLSVTFSTSGEDIYCGFRNFVKIFDVSKPGRQCESFNLKEISGQKGLVSCISENPAVPNIFAVGTLNKIIGLYTRSRELICLLNGQKNGLKQLRFSSDGSKLFSGGRMDNEIIGWDIRNLGKVLFSLERVVDTNQTIYFDLTSDEKFLVTGGTDGSLRVFNLEQGIHSNCDLKYLLKASTDCVNGVSLHRTCPIIATASGKKVRAEITNDDDADITFFYDYSKVENCIKLWWAGSVASSIDTNEAMDVTQDPT